MTYHRLMIALALLAACAALRLYLPAEGEQALAAVQGLIAEQEYVLPEEARTWLDWR